MADITKNSFLEAIGYFVGRVIAQQGGPGGSATFKSQVSVSHGVGSATEGKSYAKDTEVTKVVRDMLTKPTAVTCSMNLSQSAGSYEVGEKVTLSSIDFYATISEGELSDISDMKLELFIKKESDGNDADKVVTAMATGNDWKTGFMTNGNGYKTSVVLSTPLVFEASKVNGVYAKNDSQLAVTAKFTYKNNADTTCTVETKAYYKFNKNTVYFGWIPAADTTEARMCEDSLNEYFSSMNAMLHNSDTTKPDFFEAVVTEYGNASQREREILRPYGMQYAFNSSVSESVKAEARGLLCVAYPKSWLNGSEYAFNPKIQAGSALEYAEGFSGKTLSNFCKWQGSTNANKPSGFSEEYCVVVFGDAMPGNATKPNVMKVAIY